MDAARGSGVRLGALVERLEEEMGVRLPRDWERLTEYVVSSDEIDARELAAVLVDLGVEVPEDKWIELVSSYGLHAPRKPARR